MAGYGRIKTAAGGSLVITSAADVATTLLANKHIGAFVPMTKPKNPVYVRRTRHLSRFDFDQYYPDGERISEQELLRVLGFMHEHLASGIDVLVHCSLGKSSSAYLVIWYLMQRQDMSFAEALQTVRKQWPAVSLHISYESMLRPMATTRSRSRLLYA